MLELAHRIDAMMVPLLIAIVGAVTVAHRIDARSTYTCRAAARGALREVVVAAGLAARDARFEAVSAATRYEDLLRLCARDPESGKIYVVDDGGIVMGTIAWHDVVAPPMRVQPLEIAAAADFVTSRATRRDALAGREQDGPSRPKMMVVAARFRPLSSRSTTPTSASGCRNAGPIHSRTSSLRGAARTGGKT